MIVVGTNKLKMQIVSRFKALPYFFNLLGYGILFVNFRGSLGNGRDCVDSLPGHIGDLDVKDCYQVREN